MKTHAIIPIFIPHLGCPNDCVFCNQRKITARTCAPSADSVRATIEEWLSTLEVKRRSGDLECLEVAFYGGSFTGLDIDEQSIYLAVAKEFLDAERIDGIHLSTRPDYIDEEILDNLKAYGVKTIEIGVQSFDDDVLRRSNRGHDAKAVYRAAELIKSYGFNLGIQLMIGLPGDSLESCIYSAKEAARLQPSLARLYPTIVLDDTKLLEMYESGEYRALSREEAVQRTKEMYKILDEAGIYIMRVGLKSTDIIGDGGAINGGTYHPAFRQLVESAIARDKIEPQLDAIIHELSRTSATATATSRIDISSSPAWFSNLIGNGSENKKRWADKYPALNIKYCVDETLEDGEFSVVLQAAPKQSS